MRALRDDELDFIRRHYFLGTDFEPYRHNRTLKKAVGIERRLHNLGILEVEIPAIKGYQRTVYRLSAKGRRIVNELLSIEQIHEAAHHVRTAADRLKR